MLWHVVQDRAGTMPVVNSAGRSSNQPAVEAVRKLNYVIRTSVGRLSTFFLNLTTSQGHTLHRSGWQKLKHLAVWLPLTNCDWVRYKCAVVAVIAYQERLVRTEHVRHWPIVGELFVMPGIP